MADYISYDMEHAPYDIKGLADYMRGLVAGGPTKSGHRTPAVIVNVPVNGTDEATVRANAWMFSQVLATGVHGVMLTHAGHPGRREGVHRSRPPPDPQAGRRSRDRRRTTRCSRHADGGTDLGRLAGRDIVEKADAWPLNPNGELLLGLKLEDKYALANAEANLKVPGIGVRRMGPGRHGAVARRSRSRQRRRNGSGNARRSSEGVCRLQSQQDFLPELDEPWKRRGDDSGRRHGWTRESETAEIGRKYSKRQMPW